MNIEKVGTEIRRFIPEIQNRTVPRLIGYAIGDAGFSNMGTYVENLTPAEHNEMIQLLKRWHGGRSTKHFLERLFEKHGYKCEDMFLSCHLGTTRISCCKYFKLHFVSQFLFEKWVFLIKNNVYSLKNSFKFKIQTGVYL